MQTNTAMNTNYCLSSENTNKFNIDQSLSIYIPFIYPEHANENYIKNIFLNLNIALVKRVDFQRINNNIVAFVHMDCWFENVCVHNLQKKILDYAFNNSNIEPRIVHDDPQYWVVKQNNRPNLYNFQDRLFNLEKDILENNRLLNLRINNLEQYNLTLQKNIQNMQLWISNNHANINNLSRNIVQATPVFNYHENTRNNLWSDRLRKRNLHLNYNENSFNGF